MEQIKRIKLTIWGLVGLTGWILVIGGAAKVAATYEKPDIKAVEGGYGPWGPCQDNDGDGIPHCWRKKMDDTCVDDYNPFRTVTCLDYGMQPPGGQWGYCDYDPVGGGWVCTGKVWKPDIDTKHHHYETVDP